MGTSLEKLGEHVSSMREKGLLRKADGYDGIRRQAKRIIFFLEVLEELEEIKKSVKSILRRLESKNLE